MYTIVIPFYEGHQHIEGLLDTIPTTIHVIIVDDVSSKPYLTKRANVEVHRLEKKGYFAGAVNKGISLCTNDVLVLNQDVYFTDTSWQKTIEDNRDEYAFIGESIKGTREDFPHGYIHGTFMYMRRDAIEAVGLLNETIYPLWGNTAEWQLRICRNGYKALPVASIPGFVHKRKDGERYGSSISKLVNENKRDRGKLIRTPPEVSVVIPVHGIKYAKYLPQTIASLIGGETDLGTSNGQTLQSFEVIIVEDGPNRETSNLIKKLSGDGWLGIRHIQIKRNPLDRDGKYIGKPSALNVGIKKARGKYITVLDADDMMEESRLEKLWKTAEAQSGKKVVCDDSWLFTDGKRTKRISMNKYDFDDMAYRNSMHIGIFYPKKAWVEAGGYPESMLYGREDWAFNVALGLKGWCGVNLREHLYLYRRETQNRTLVNTTREWHNKFLETIQRSFPDYYLKGEVPTMCCGKKSGGLKGVGKSSAKSAKRTGMIKTKNGLAYPGDDGFTWVAYKGSKTASFTIWGVSTGTAYRVFPSKPFLAADSDLSTNKPNLYGLFEVYLHGKRQYVSFESPVIKTPTVLIAEEVVHVSPDVKDEPASVQFATDAFGSGEREPVGYAHVSLEVTEEPKEFEEAFDTGIVLGTVSSLSMFIETGTLEREQLEELLAVELSNKNRKSAVKKIEEALDGLSS